VHYRNSPVNYYMDVKRFALFFSLTCMFLIAACNPGGHPPRIGSDAPNFTITDSQHTVELNKLRGKPVVLNFWATWCPPCIEEMPSLVQLQKQMGDKVTILAVSEDADDAAYKQFIHDHNVDLLTVREGSKKVSDTYGTFRYPETYVIDRNGKIVRKFIGATNWTSPDIIDYLNKL